MEEKIINVPEQHCHSSLSHDGSSNMILMTSAAIIQGCEKITFTEHYDCYDGVSRTKGKCVNLEKYHQKIKKARNFYGKEIEIGFGIEVGMRSEPQVAEKIMQEIGQHYFDLIIGSVHITNGIDISMDSSFFEGKCKRKAYGEYFEEMSRCIDIYHEMFDVIGHLDYITRYGNYEPNGLGRVFNEQIDEILMKIIKYGKGLEINTSGFAKGFDTTNPSFKIIKRFHELGGKYITIGSDAHNIKNVAGHFNEAIAVAKDAGFKDVTYYKNRQPILIPFPD